MAHGDAREGETGEWSGLPVLFTLPRNMVYPDIVGKCSPTQLCQLRCLITVISKLHVSALKPSSGSLLTLILLTWRIW
jgi:hypothetical protein